MHHIIIYYFDHHQIAKNYCYLREHKTIKCV